MIDLLHDMLLLVVAIIVMIIAAPFVVYFLSQIQMRAWIETYQKLNNNSLKEKDDVKKERK